MTDKPNGSDQAQPAPAPGQPKVQAQLVITLLETGQVQISGPIDNPLLTHGLLGVAAAIMATRQQEANAPRIALPQSHVPFMKRPFLPK
jgi:hypothetical protein